MNGEVQKYEKIINETLVKIEKSKFVTETEKKGKEFEEYDKKVRDSQSQLIADQKHAFIDFKDALKQVSNRLLTVSGMFDKADQLQDRQNFADSTGTPFEHLNNFVEMGIISKKADETYLRDAYGKMAGLFKQRGAKEFDQDKLIQALSQQKGQEHLIEELKLAKDMTAFIKLLIQAMAQGKNDKKINDLIGKEISSDYGTQAVITDAGVLQYLPKAQEVTKQTKDAKARVFEVGRNNRAKQEQLGATQAASTAQSAPILNAWNNFFEHFMQQHPEFSKTLLSFGALGSALDDIYGAIKPIVGAALTMRLSMMAFSLSTTSLSGLMSGGLSAIALALTRFTAFGSILALLYESAKTAANTTTDGVNGMYGSIAVPRAETPEEVAKSKEKIEKDKQQDWERNAPYMSLVNQNMKDQKLVLNKEWNEYQYVNTKTGKVANMGMVGYGLDEVKHASDEWQANAQKRQEFQEKTGTKLIMVPKDRGLFHKRGSIEVVAIDANGNQVANFNRKLNMPIQDMINKLPTNYKHYLNTESRLPTIDANVVRSSPVFSKTLTKDQPFNQGLSIDMSKIKEQMSTSLQLSKQLLNTPNTMQQRFNFYFTLPQTNSGKIEHSFDHNSVVSRKGGSPISNVDKAFPNFGGKGTH
ncbi:hypothetical protein [Commensalibacter communis]|uniref:hypothetical protein n=1 Tax=Commensalibacter communis TaxID=2972786 RepID=UPI0022FF645E|nr:hypothetical protein [Commensalibacter communis]CAI3960653.1 unnamed protein product [Commensalibacter communis]